MKTIRMSRSLASVLVLCLPVALAACATPASDARHGSGIGLAVGAPTGLSFKSWLEGRSAVQLGTAWDFGGPRDKLTLTADFLGFPERAPGIEGAPETLRTYVGIGARIRTQDGRDDRAGVRVPLGLTYAAPRSPLEVFGELAPTLDVAPGTDLDIDLGLGVRIFF